MIRALLVPHGTLAKVGKALGIGDNIYAYASKWKIPSPVKPRDRNRQITAKQLERAKELKADGVPVTRIALELGVHRTTIHRNFRSTPASD
jgi:DNA invertase Pin-like site-specific DNA recombinase